MKRFLFIFLVVIVFPLFSFRSVYAEEMLLEFIFDSRIMDPNGEIGVKVDSDLYDEDNHNFVIRPVIEKGTVYIWDRKNEVWVSDVALWSKLPFLSSDMKLKMVGLNNNFTEITFQIQDVIEAKIYETNKLKIWPTSVLTSYIEKININIIRFSSLFSD